MKYSTTIMCVLVAVLSCACTKREETTQEAEMRVVKDKYEQNIAEIKDRLPESQIVARIQGSNALIHKFSDEKTGATCYFIDNRSNNISCVK